MTILTKGDEIVEYTRERRNRNCIAKQPVFGKRFYILVHIVGSDWTVPQKIRFVAKSNNDSK